MGAKGWSGDERRLVDLWRRAKEVAVWCRLGGWMLVAVRLRRKRREESGNEGEKRKESEKGRGKTEGIAGRGEEKNGK